MLLNFFTFVECNLLVPLFVLVLFHHPSKLHRLGNFSLGFGTCEFQRLLWMLKSSAPDGPRVNPRTGWIRAGFVCVGDVETKTLLQVR